MNLVRFVPSGPLPFRWLTVLLAAGSLATQAAAPLLPVDLAGPWRFQLDPADAGLDGRWFERTLQDTPTVTLPGTLSAQGLGDDVTVDTQWTGQIVDKSWFTAPEYAPYRQPGHVKIPFWLQPEKYYVGAAWYQRDVDIPAAWRGQRVVLFLERPHWETRVWLDDRLVGTNTSLSTPHERALGLDLTPGRHRLTVRVDNRLVVDVGVNSHSVSDHTQGNWNGIVGALELRATPPVWIEDLQVFPRLATRSIAIKGQVGNATGQPGEGRLRLHADFATLMSSRASDKGVDVRWDKDGGHFETELSLAAPALLWDEFDPVTYQLTAMFEEGHAKTITFGLREFAADGTQFSLNGRRTFLRGTLECAIFPKTGHPPTDEASWEHVFRAAQAHGLNHLRFHSWCPPEAAFAVADRLGVLLHVECASWANGSTTLGDGRPVDRWLYEETDRILKYYGNHPSFVLMAYGNEPGGPKHAAFLARWVSQYKAQDPRRLYTSGAGWPEIPENQWHSSPDPRVQAWGGGLNSRINARPPETLTDYRDYIAARAVPVVSHEIGQWCVYPNFDEIPKYTGYLKARNFEVFRDTLAAHRMDDLARPFLLASGKLQTLCYKEDIESALRTPGMGGFQLLDLHDFPGQGTALVGVLDPFWEEKGYVTPAEYSRFCHATVPLARLPKRVFTADETFTAELEVSHFGPAPIAPANVSWQFIRDDGAVIGQGERGLPGIPIGNGTSVGSVRLELRGQRAPARYRLVVRLFAPAARPPRTNADPQPTALRQFENDWDVWVYPTRVGTEAPPEVRVVRELDAEAQAALEAGGKVLWMLPPARVAPDPKLGKVALGFSSIFWNTAWTGRQAPHTLGILCDPKHPALAAFPTEFHSNWQWWYLLNRAGAMILDGLPPTLRPTVQVIDDWVTARRLGLLFEAKVGPGRLLVCSIDLEHALEDNPVARQFRHSLTRYLASDGFKPAVSITADQARQVARSRTTAMEKLGARVSRASRAQPGHEAELVLDGDPGTLWHTAWNGTAPGFPHELVVELARPTALRGARLWPRQDRNRNGWIKDYALYASLDGVAWGDPAARGAFPPTAEAQEVGFATPVTARFVRLVVLSGHAQGPWASLAELELELQP